MVSPVGWLVVLLQMDKKTLVKVLGSQRALIPGFDTNPTDITTKYESPGKVIVKFREIQESPGRKNTVIVSTAYCRRKPERSGNAPTQIEWYLLEEETYAK